MKKITYYLSEGKTMPEFCIECDKELEDEEDYYYHGQGMFTCCEECAEKFEGK